MIMRAKPMKLSVVIGPLEIAVEDKLNLTCLVFPYVEEEYSGLSGYAGISKLV